MNNKNIIKCPQCHYNINSNISVCPHCLFKIEDFLKTSDKLLNYVSSLIYDRNYLECTKVLLQSAVYDNAHAIYMLAYIFKENLINSEDNEFNYIRCVQRSAFLGYKEAIEEYKVLSSLTVNIKRINGNAKLKLYHDKLIQLINGNKKDSVDISVTINKDEGEILGNIAESNGNLSEINYEKENLSILKEEKERFKDVISSIENLILKLGNKEEEEPFESYDDDYRRDEVLKRERNKRNDDNRKLLSKIKERPYFGVLDLTYPDEHKDEILLVGEQSLANGSYQITTPFNETGKIMYGEPTAEWKYLDKTLKKTRRVILKRRRWVVINNGNFASAREDYNLKDGFVKEAYDKYLDTVLRARHSNSKITNILSSLHKQQSHVITTEIYKNLIMQGCAGSGKSTILINRIKYYLLNTNYDPNSLIVVTHSNKFKSFIDPLIKELKLYNLKIYNPLELYINALNLICSNEQNNSKWSDLIETNIYCDKQFVLEDDDKLPKDIVEYFYSKQLIDKIIKLKNITVREFTPGKLKEHGINDHGDILKSILGKKEYDLLPKYDKKSRVIHKCELYCVLLFYFLKTGIPKNTYTQKLDYKLLSIDEAQEFSINELNLFKSIYNCNINLFGDINQRFNSWGIKDWKEVSSKLGDFEYCEFNKSYRNSEEIINYVNKVCDLNIETVGINGYDVINLKTDDLEVYAKRSPSGKDIAILCSKNEILNFKKLFPDLANLILPINEAKGIEFADVFVFDKNLTKVEKYVAYTRARNYLFLIK